LTTFTRITRPVIAAAAVLAVAAPAAQARPFDGPAGNAAASVRATNGGVSPIVASLPPDRVDRIGSAGASAGEPVALSPDRADGLGSARLPTVPQPTVVVRTTTSDAFNWTDATLGAASGLAAGIIAVGAAMALRGRRRVALSS
jgi:hypothetical protein